MPPSVFPAHISLNAFRQLHFEVSQGTSNSTSPTLNSPSQPPCAPLHHHQSKTKVVLPPLFLILVKEHHLILFLKPGQLIQSCSFYFYSFKIIQIILHQFSIGQDATLSLPWMWVESLVGEKRFCMLHSMTKNKGIKNLIKI